MSTSISTPMDDASGTHDAPRMTTSARIAIAAGVGAVALLIWHSVSNDHGAAVHHEVHAPHLWGIGIVPFIAILGAIAIFPLLPATHHWWESNLNRLAVALICGAATLVYALAIGGVSKAIAILDHAIVAEYIPFIMLLFSLYVISGGINLRGDLAAHPSTNTAFLAIGALAASFIGTTGASMLLIRPLLQTNRDRKHVVHTVVFFIFLVSNVGGCLLPIGDPPLFLGFLKGVPFFWTFNLWKEWAACCVILLILYFIWDTMAYKKERKTDIQRDESHKQPLRLTGWINFLWLGGVVASVAFIVPHKPFPGFGPDGFHSFPFMRELFMLAFVALSLKTTPKGVREANHFNYAAILEVAALFVGIFICMQIPVEVLQVNGAALGLSESWHYFWATGLLSSVLDNAPTYVVFFETAKALPPVEGVKLVAGLAEPLLIAISLGAVFMGAMTYIGNGPNFMVKAIAEQSGVRMPSFFGYMIRYSIPVLIPVFVVITVIFLVLFGS